MCMTVDILASVIPFFVLLSIPLLFLLLWASCSLLGKELILVVAVLGGVTYFSAAFNEHLITVPVPSLQNSLMKGPLVWPYSFEQSFINSGFWNLWLRIFKCCYWLCEFQFGVYSRLRPQGSKAENPQPENLQARQEPL